MNPSKARAFSGRTETKKTKAQGRMPETDPTATIVRGWLKSDALKNTKRLSIINLVPIIETNSRNVQELIDSWTGPDLKQIFHQTLKTVLFKDDGTLDNIRIICAWGDPNENNKAWVREGQRWFFDFIKNFNAKEQTDERKLQQRIFRLKFGQGHSTRDYPPHPNLNPSLKGNNNELTLMELEHE